MMDSNNNMIDYGKFQLSLKRLEEQYENHRTLAPALPELIREGVCESVIQRFETCYDCLWKVLRRYLVESLGLVDIPNSPKPIFRLANENHLFASPVKQWLQYADARIGTAHDYDGEKAKACLTLMSDFLGDAISLYQTMSGKTWE